MREFDVKPSELEAAFSANERLVLKLNRYKNEVESIRRNLRLQIANSGNLGSRLDSYTRAMDIEGRQLAAFNTAGENAKNHYVQSEAKILMRYFGDALGINLPQGLVNAIEGADITGLLTVVDKVKTAKDIVFGEGEIIIGGIPIKYDNSGDAPKFSVDYADYVKHKAELEGRELTGWEKFWSDGYKGSFISGEKSVTGTILGIEGGAAVTDGLLSYKTGGSATAEMDFEKGNVGAEAKASGEIHAAEGSAELHYGLASTEAHISVGNVAAEGEIAATMYKDGKLDPRFAAVAAAGANVVSGSINSKIGNDQFDVHSKASGELLGAHAEAGVQIGKVKYKDENGNEVEAYGAQATVGAEAYLAKGEVSGGFKIFGYDIDFSLEGKAGGAGVKAGVTATTGGIEGELGAGLGLGLGIKFHISK